MGAKNLVTDCSNCFSQADTMVHLKHGPQLAYYLASKVPDGIFALYRLTKQLKLRWVSGKPVIDNGRLVYISFSYSGSRSKVVEHSVQLRCDRAAAVESELFSVYFDEGNYFPQQLPIETVALVQT